MSLFSPLPAMLQLSIIIPLFNEAPSLKHTVAEVQRVMADQLPPDQWELILVNDGSTDETSSIAHHLAQSNVSMTVIDHPRNLGLGQALKTGFATASGTFIGILDADLSYDPDCLLTMLELHQKADLAMVVASPYHPQGKTTGIPFSRWLLSRSANLYLSWAVAGQLHTLTGMVRVYRTSFLNSISLQSSRNDLNIETISLALQHGKLIGEFPAHLTWKREIRQKGLPRYPLRHWIRHIFGVLYQGLHLRSIQRKSASIQAYH